MSDTYTPGAGMADELDDDEKALFEGGAETTEEPAPIEEAPVAEATTEEPAAVAEAQDEDGLGPDDIHDDVNKGRFIRHGAFHRERMKRQEVERERDADRAELMRQREERARIDERLQLIMRAQQQEQEQEQQTDEQSQVPDPEQDPFAYMRYLENQISALSQQTQGNDARFRQQDEYATVKTAFQQDANAFTQREPDFINGYQYLMRARDRELQRLGRNNAQERAQIINQEELMIVSECLRNGKSAAELVYELAKDRGYSKSIPEPAPSPAPVQNGLAAAQRPSAVAQVAAIQKGTAAAKSLGSAAGGSNQPLTAELLASMSEAEFDVVYSKMSREQRREYFGG
jgi:hypothetical protein